MYKETYFIMLNKSFIFVPYWVETVLKRNNLNTSEVLNYPTLKTLLSLNDLAQLISLQKLDEIKIIKELDSTQCLFNSWRNSTQKSQLTELDSVLEPLSCSKDLTLDLIERLSLCNAPMSYDYTLPSYKILDLNREVTAVILNPGFMDFESDKINYTNFISDLLKSLYVYNTVTEVSNYPLFNSYVHLLEDTMRK